jgi:hypothetical protein
MIKWNELTSAQVQYVLANVPDPLAVFLGFPPARQAAEERLGDPRRWLINEEND